MKRYKIIDKRPEVSEEMIKGSMNFEGLISKQGVSVENSSFRLLKSLAVTGVVLLLGYLSVVYFFIRENKTNERTAEQVLITDDRNLELTETKNKATKNVFVESDETEIEENSQKKADNETLSENTIVPFKEHVQLPVKTESASATPQKIEKETTNYDYVEAEPIDGIASLYEYFDQTLKYPSEALPDSIQGVTLVTFTVNTAGRAEQITIEKSLGPSFDKEAVRLLQRMPKWRPASINGQSINSKVSIPLTFRIEK